MSLDLPRLAEQVRIGTAPTILHQIEADGTALALWQRRLAPELADWLDTLPVGQLPQLRQTLPLARIRSRVKEACHMVGLPTGDGPTWLQAEICHLAHLAADLFDTTQLHLRLAPVQRRTCPKWHVDAVTMRMICTLRGPGTEWGPIGPGGAPRETHQMTRGEVGLFRGALWPGAELAALLHRSPIASITQPRLVLVIDPGAAT